MPAILRRSSRRCCKSSTSSWPVRLCGKPSRPSVKANGSAAIAAGVYCERRSRRRSAATDAARSVAAAATRSTRTLRRRSTSSRCTTRRRRRGRRRTRWPSDCRQGRTTARSARGCARSWTCCANSTSPSPRRLQATRASTAVGTASSSRTSATNGTRSGWLTGSPKATSFPRRRRDR
jgi:hypothetical protein